MLTVQNELMQYFIAGASQSKDSNNSLKHSLNRCHTASKGHAFTCVSIYLDYPKTLKSQNLKFR